MYGERETSQKTTKNGLLMDTIRKAREEGKQECCVHTEKVKRQLWKTLEFLHL